MTPDEKAQLARQKQIARTPEIKVERREPLDGQGELFGDDSAIVTVDDIVEVIHAEIHRAGSLRALAREWGVSAELVSKVVKCLS